MAWRLQAEGMATTRTPASRAPWNKPAPRKAKPTKLSAAKKARAKARAKRAGRPYPNLVDNMRAAAGSRKATPKKRAAKKAAAKKNAAPKKRAAKKRAAKKAAPKKKAAKKRSAGKTSAERSVRKSRTAKSARPREKDPKGGLTAAGREAFRKREGAHLEPGVKKRASEMSRAEMRRKGSWAVRFYGRTPLPPLVDAKGEPTRFALSAHAWGEPVPRTTAAARKIAEKGRRLLEKARAS